MTSRYDKLNRRLEQIEPRGELPTPTLPAPSPSALEAFSDAARQLPTDQAALQGSGPVSGFAPGGTWETSGPSEVARPLAEPARSEFSRFLVGGYDDDRGMFVLVRPRD